MLPNISAVHAWAQDSEAPPFCFSESNEKVSNSLTYVQARWAHALYTRWMGSVWAAATELAQEPPLPSFLSAKLLSEQQTRLKPLQHAWVLSLSAY